MLNLPEYDFLRTDEHLGKNIVYLTISGSRAYGTNNENSDTDEEKERHILKSIQSRMLNAKTEYELEKGAIEFIIPKGEDEIKVNIDVKNLSLRRFLALNSDLNNMLRNYAKLNHRNNKKDEAHLRKHAMHLIRLYLTGIDILKNRQVITYRENDLPMLRAIRNGEITFSDVFKIANEYESKMKKAYENSKLPEDTDTEKINELLISIYQEHFAGGS